MSRWFRYEDVMRQKLLILLNDGHSTPPPPFFFCFENCGGGGDDWVGVGIIVSLLFMHSKQTDVRSPFNKISFKTSVANFIKST